MTSVRAAVIVVSDRCARGEAQDLSGPQAVFHLTQAGFAVDDVVIVPDGAQSVTTALRTALDDGAQFVVTSGGTGIGPRDETPEGTRPVVTKELPGIMEVLRGHGYVRVPTAALSRGLAGVTESGALVVNLPGSPGGVTDSLDVLLPLVPHVVSQLDGGDHA